MLSNLFDEYSLNARVRPALLAFLPIVIFAYLAFPQLYEVAAGAMSILIVGGLITALAHYCRYRGKIAEKAFFSSWGGKPTTVILRHRDFALDSITKRRYRDFFSRNINGWSSPSVEEEAENPIEADEHYESAVRWLLERTRDTKRYNILFKENISYGFRRNCYGIKWHACLLSFIPIVLILVDYWCSRYTFIQSSVLFMGASAIFSFVLFIWWAFVVTDDWVKDTAVSYAMRLLASCDIDDHT